MRKSRSVLRRIGAVVLWPVRAMVAPVRWAARLAASVFSLRDVFVFGGLGAACYGIAQMHVPAAWIAGGSVLLLIGLRR